MRLTPGVGSIALDGEREIEIRKEDQIEVSLSLDGPLTIDVSAAMREAAGRGLPNGQRYALVRAIFIDQRRLVQFVAVESPLG